MFAWPRLGSAATVTTQNTGDLGLCFSFTISSTTVTKIYTANAIDREITFQNTDSTYYVNAGTFSAVNATSGTPRFIIPPKPTTLTLNGTFSIWAIAEAGASSIEVVGCKERDSKDTQ